MKHIRLGHFDARPWLVEALSNFPGLKGVVSHKSGTKGEHPHLHVFWEGEAVTSATIKNRLRAHDSRFGELKGNGDWCLKPHDSWNNWAEYVTSNLTHKVEIPFGDLPARSALKSVKHASSPSSLNPAVVVVKPKKKPMKDRIVDYCIDVLGWELDVTNPTPDQVYRACCACFTFNFHNGQGIAVMRHCIWEFSDEEARENLMDRQRHNFISSL